MPFLDIFQKRVKNIFHVGERHFFGSLYKRVSVFCQNRFYVGDLRRLREISPLFWGNLIFWDFFGFFQKSAFCCCSTLLPEMLRNNFNEKRNIFSVREKKISL